MINVNAQADVLTSLHTPLLTFLHVLFPFRIQCAYGFCLSFLYEMGKNQLSILSPRFISIFSGSKLITSNFSYIHLMCPCRKVIFSQIRKPENAWEFIDIYLVKNVKLFIFGINLS